jgi:outer membrane protein assembly factor BamB
LFGGTETDPVVSGPIVVVASTDQSLYGVSVGGMEWRVRTSSPLTLQPASYKNRIYVATKDWGFACFEASSGKKLWGAADVTGTPVGIRNGYLLVWNKGTITRIDAQHGDVIDRTTLATVRTVWTDSFEDGTLFAASDTGLVLRLNPAK